MLECAESRRIGGEGHHRWSGWGVLECVESRHIGGGLISEESTKDSLAVSLLVDFKMFAISTAGLEPGAQWALDKYYHVNESCIDGCTDDL